MNTEHTVLDFKGNQYPDGLLIIGYSEGADSSTAEVTIKPFVGMWLDSGQKDKTVGPALQNWASDIQTSAQNTSFTAVHGSSSSTAGGESWAREMWDLANASRPSGSYSWYVTNRLHSAVSKALSQIHCERVGNDVSFAVQRSTTGTDNLGSNHTAPGDPSETPLDASRGPLTTHSTEEQSPKEGLGGDPFADDAYPAE